MSGRRGKIKCKVVESTIKNKDVLDMFHEVLGTGPDSALNPEIVYPKYLLIHRHCGRFLQLLETFRDSTVLAHFEGPAQQLAAYTAALRQEEEASFTAPDLAAAHPPSALQAATGLLARYHEMTAEEYETFQAAYRGVKGCNLVNTIVVTCKNLLPHRASLEDPSPEKLRGRFLTATAGLVFAPLPDLPGLNFKQLFISDLLEEPDRRFLLMILHKLFTIGHDLYEAISTPDVDVASFVDVVIGSLDEVKRHIPRCTEAFDKIRESVDLLQGNFGDYYKDCMATGNPSLLMENFVLDVSKNTKASPKITAQFRRIISHYREQAASRSSNPQLQTLFQHVDRNFQELERQSAASPEDGSVSLDDAASEESEGAHPPPQLDAIAEEPAPAATRTSGSRRRRMRAKRVKAARRAKSLPTVPSATPPVAEDGSASSSDSEAPPAPAADGAVLQTAAPPVAADGAESSSSESPSDEAPPAPAADGAVLQTADPAGSSAPAEDPPPVPVPETPLVRCCSVPEERPEEPESSAPGCSEGALAPR